MNGTAAAAAAAATTTTTTTITTTIQTGSKLIILPVAVSSASRCTVVTKAS